MQTREDRIYRQYRVLRRGKRACCDKHWLGQGPEIWMPLARTWKMSIKEIKAIIAREKVRRAEVSDTR